MIVLNGELWVGGDSWSLEVTLWHGRGDNGPAWASAVIVKKMTPAGKPQWRGVSGVPGLGLSVPFSLDTSGSVLNLWEEEKRPRNFWRSIKLWKGWGKDKERSGQEADDGQHHIGGHQARGNQLQAEVGHVGEFRPGLASHSCRHGKLLQRKQKEHNIQVDQISMDILIKVVFEC